MTTLDARPVADPDAVARGELRERRLLEHDAYAYGYADGLEAGRLAAEREMTQWWAALARTVRANAERLRGTVPEPEIRSYGGGDDTIWFTRAERESWLTPDD